MSFIGLVGIALGCYLLYAKKDKQVTINTTWSIVIIALGILIVLSC